MSKYTPGGRLKGATSRRSVMSTRMGLRLGLGIRRARGSLIDYASFMAFDPRDIAGLVAWYDPTDATTVAVSGGLVSQISDKSGSGLHLVQATGGAQPTYADAASGIVQTLNNKNSIEFTGAQYLAKTSGVSLAAGAYTAINAMYMRSSSASGARGLTLAPASADLIANGYIPERKNTTVSEIGAYTAGAIGIPHPITYNTWFVHSTDRSASTMRGWLNGGDFKSVAVSALATITQIAFGNSISGVGTFGTSFLSGKWAGSLIYQGVLSDFDRQRLEGWLAWKIGIQSLLDPAQLYLAAPPFSLRDISGLVGWYDPTDAARVTLATGVSQLSDKSGNSKHIVQATGANQPAYAADAAIGNQNAITCNGTTANLLNSAMALTALSGLTYISAGTMAAATVASGRLMSFSLAATADNAGVGATTGPKRNVSANAVGASGGTISLNHATMALDTYFIEAIRRENSLLRSQLNGGDLQSAVPDTLVTTIDRLCLGTGIIAGGVGTQFWAGKFAGTAIYNSILSDDLMARGEGFFAWKLGLAGSLVAGHTWKAAPPTIVGLSAVSKLLTAPVSLVANTTTAASHTSTLFTPPSLTPLFAWVIVRRDTGGAAVSPTFTDTEGGVWAVLSDTELTVTGSLRCLLLWKRSAFFPIPITCTAASASATGVGIAVFTVGNAPTDFSNIKIATNAAGDPAPTLDNPPAPNSMVLVFYGGYGTASAGAPANYTQIFSTATGNMRSTADYDPDNAAAGVVWATGNTNSVSVLLEIKQP